jgi:hypothetical protein
MDSLDRSPLIEVLNRCTEYALQLEGNPRDGLKQIQIKNAAQKIALAAFREAAEEVLVEYRALADRSNITPLIPPASLTRPWHRKLSRVIPYYPACCRLVNWLWTANARSSVSLHADRVTRLAATIATIRDYQDMPIAAIERVEVDYPVAVSVRICSRVREIAFKNLAA